jgi:hypothetical protein
MTIDKSKLVMSKKRGRDALYSDEDKQQWFELNKQGYTQTSIAEASGATLRTVNAAIIKLRKEQGE